MLLLAKVPAGQGVPLSATFLRPEENFVPSFVLEILSDWRAQAPLGTQARVTATGTSSLAATEWDEIVIYAGEMALVMISQIMAALELLVWAF